MFRKPPPLPYTSYLPPETERNYIPILWARIGAYAVLVVTLAVVAWQMESRTLAVMRRAQRADDRYLAALAELQQRDDEATRRQALEAANQVARVDRSQGAIQRWTGAVRAFWAGKNIYRPLPAGDVGDPLTGALLPGRSLPSPRSPEVGQSPQKLAEGEVWLHPNMPFVVILLTPLAWLPMPAVALIVSLLKLAVLAASIWMLAEAVNHHPGTGPQSGTGFQGGTGPHGGTGFQPVLQPVRMADWVLGLGVLFALPFVISDFQHGNTNIFVLGALVLHVWLFSRGRDAWAGGALALAICLKLTPGIFALYWLHQRNWKLLGGLAIGLAAMVVGVPVMLVGPEAYDVLMGTWLSNLVIPGLLKGAPYPIHINQSLTGVFNRLFMHGNIYFNPDDTAVARDFGYVNVAGLSLSLAAGRAVLTAMKLGLVATMAWAIGWRLLPRHDGRRGLHYGLLACGMLILNQRTWDEHATVLLLASLPLWYAIVYGRLARGLRRGLLAALVAGGLLVLLTKEGVFILFAGKERGKLLADIAAAYGPGLTFFLVLFVLCSILLRALRDRPGRQQPYLAEGARSSELAAR